MGKSGRMIRIMSKLNCIGCGKVGCDGKEGCDWYDSTKLSEEINPQEKPEKKSWEEELKG